MPDFKALFSAVLLLLTLLSSPLSAAQSVWTPLAEQIITELEQAEQHYRSGDSQAAKRAVIKAYFGIFESRKMEAAMRMELGARHTYKVERRFGQIRKAVKKALDADAVAEQIAELSVALRRDAEKLDTAAIPAEVFKVNQ
ncbi:hypothetical protein BOW53_10015 [Solemya pervernicosa gill symbiont]|uniref:Iron permease n=1 Tax=Solemya pervernicosa gill symbiont TaxID=642797 RepID=A0A1T2L489_9GAMM|nr:hypothetical protein [Solemya pervernicosa gill symbiont]OOZ39850.1 hypothetical protein BOW53_10015 [Solemya pervernicosa gill symbiont]